MYSVCLVNAVMFITIFIIITKTLGFVLMWKCLSVIFQDQNCLIVAKKTYLGLLFVIFGFQIFSLTSKRFVIFNENLK